MKIQFALLISFLSAVMFSCDGVQVQSAGGSPPPGFTIGVKAIDSPRDFPYLQSFTWARQGNLILMFGGRTEGFHGLNEMDTVFRSSKSNTSIYVINLEDFSFSSLPLDLNDTANLFFTRTNMQFWQEGDTLFATGGFGQALPTDLQGNYTGSTIMAISVSKMINAVQQQGDPQSAVLMQASSPFVQVTGGEMAYVNGWLFLMFGQNYDSVYTTGKTGDYTSAVRQFRFVNSQIIDTTSFFSDDYHRRDLSMVEVTQQAGSFFAAFGGVFTSEDNGYLNPLYFNLENTAAQHKKDTLVQKTSQYNCATAVIYDPASDACVTVLFGGIGQYQYHPETKKWEEGDHGAKLPFVKTITQMIYDNGVMTQDIQLPPEEPELPAYCGASGVFFPDTDYLMSGQTIDYSKLTTGTTVIGWLYGGIASPRPTSSSLYPTTLNKTIYQVLLNKSTGQATN